MKAHQLLLITYTLLIPQLSFSMGCADIILKAKPTGPKGGKSSCTLEEHSIGTERGSTESIYKCGSVKYKLINLEDYTCTATILKK